MENNTTVNIQFPPNSEILIHEKILFVSNNAGTTIMEVMLLISVPILSSLLYSLYLHSMKIDFMLNWKRIIILYFTDQLFVALPSLLALTILANHLLLVNAVLCGSCLMLLLWKVGTQMKDFIYVFQRNVYGDSNYMTNYKAAMQITTCICILAVDFNIFPRRFGKTETYGVSIMDLGVGGFVLSMALTSRFTRSRERVSFKHVYKSCFQSLILIFLGILRVVLVKSNNYQECITEYGVHWNFFFTLAIVKTIVTLFLCVLPFFQKQVCYLVLSVFTICCYQYALSRMELTYIIQHGLSGDDSRLSLLDANREGIISCVGYLSIYFFGLFIGSQLFKTRLKPFNKICWLFLWFIMGSACLYFISIPISRQMVNLSYYFLQITANCFSLLGFLIGEAIVKALYCLDKKNDLTLNLDITSSNLSESVTQNLLIYFLIGNLFTGIVNMTFDTLRSTDVESYAILGVYLLVLNTIVWFIFLIQNG